MTRREELAQADADDLLIGMGHWPWPLRPIDDDGQTCRQDGEVWPCIRARQVARISAAARAEALAEIRAGVEAELALVGEPPDASESGAAAAYHWVLALLDPPKSVPDVGSPCPLCGRPLDPGEWDAGPECENPDCTWGRSVST